MEVFWGKTSVQLQHIYYHIHPDDVRGGEVFKMSEAEFDHYEIARRALDLARFLPLIPESKRER